MTEQMVKMSAKDIDAMMAEIKQLTEENARLRDALVLAKIQGCKADRDSIIDEALKGQP